MGCEQLWLWQRGWNHRKLQHLMHWTKRKCFPIHLPWPVYGHPLKWKHKWLGHYFQDSTQWRFKILSTPEDCVTISIVKDPFIKSNTLMNPDSSAVIISVWFEWRTAELMLALLVNSFWHFNPGKSQILTVPSVEAVKSQCIAAWNPAAVTFPVWPWRIFFAWIFAVDATEKKH